MRRAVDRNTLLILLFVVVFSVMFIVEARQADVHSSRNTN